MCIGVPGKITAIADGMQARVEVCGALDTLAALQNMFDVEPDVGPLLFGEESR